jgi:hypothetical protein
MPDTIAVTFPALFSGSCMEIDDPAPLDVAAVPCFVITGPYATWPADTLNVPESGFPAAD